MIALWGTIPELFEAQASQVAARTAVSDGKRETSFEELRQQVDTIAGFLLQQDLPKGAMIEHGMLLADGLRLERDLGLTRDDRVLLIGSPAAVSVYRSMVGALLTGASVHPFDLASRDLQEFAP